MASELHAQRSLVFLVLLAVGLVVILILPFWAPLTLAAVVAAALDGWMDRLSEVFRGRRSLAALALAAGVLLAVVLPLGGLGAAVVQQVLDGIQWVRGALASEGIEGLLHRLPDAVQEVIRRLVAALPDPQRLIQSVAAAGSGETAHVVGGLVVKTGTTVFQAGLFLIALFFFLVDGERLVDWLDGHVPLRPGQLRTLLGEFRRTSVTVIRASLATAVIQTATGVVGYLIARAPNPLFLALATFVVALIPAVGGSVMVVAVGLLLMATGHLVSGAFLVVWGLAVVSLVDNIARPFLLRGGTSMHGGLLFFALLGGLAVFGGMGLIIGPLALTFLVTTLNMYRREFGPPGDFAVAVEAPRPAATPSTGVQPEAEATGAAPADGSKPPAA